MNEDATPSSEGRMPQRGKALKEKLGLGEGWMFVPETDGFVKSVPNPVPAELQKVYDKQNRHTL